MSKRFLSGLAAVALLLGGAARARAEYLVTDLGTLGWWASNALGISDAGQALGYSSSLTGQHAFLTSGGHMVDLGTPISGGFPNPASWGYAITSAGNVVLSVPVKAPPEGVSLSTRAFVYSWGKMT